MCISISKSKSCYVYCHLGNIRHVDKAAPDNRGHEIVQVNNYYPYGSMHADGNRGQEVQTHKYNGKEFDTMHGLNLYDYSARQYDPAIGQFTSMDPLCEKYYHISPYAYCAGNPVKYVDPTGCEPDSSAAQMMSNVAYEDGKRLTKNQIKQLSKKGWVMLRRYYNKKNGFKAVLFGLDTNFKKGVSESANPSEYVLAFAGTDDLTDALIDAENFIGIPTSQQSDAINVALNVEKIAKGKEITFVGHSLGGDLTETASAWTQHKGITFNPASSCYLTKFAAYMNGGAPQITQYRNLGDPVGVIQDMFLRSAPGIRAYYFSMSHSVNSFYSSFRYRKNNGGCGLW